MKKRKLVVIMSLLCLAAIIILVACRKKESNDDTNDVITLEAGQTLVYAKVDAISGNEMTYTELEPQEISTNSDDKEKSGNDGTENFQPDSERPENPQPDGETTENPQPDVEATENHQSGSEESSNSKPGSGRGSNHVDFSEYEGITTDDDGNMTGYVSTGVTNTLLIPVGTDVYTTLGNTTTFSRIANGDLIKMVLESDNGNEIIMKIWIM